MVLSKLITNSGVAYVISKPFGKIFSKVTGLPGIGSSVYLFSFLSGYPSGVIASAELYKNGLISKNDAERLCAISNNTGPALPVILIGARMFNNPCLGVTVYIIQILSSITTCLMFKSKTATGREEVYSNSYTKDLLTAITESLEGGIKSTAIMCGYIIVFNVLGDAISNICNHSFAFEVVRPFIEIVSGSAEITEFPHAISTLILSCTVTFGGACVHMQAASVMSSLGLSVKAHLYFKVTQTLLSFVFSCVVILLFQSGLF